MVSLVGFPAIRFPSQGDHTAGKTRWTESSEAQPCFFSDLPREAAALAGLEQLITPMHQHHYWLYIEIAVGCHSPPAMAGEDMCMEDACLAFALFRDLARNSCDLPISPESTCIASAAEN